MIFNKSNKSLLEDYYYNFKPIKLYTLHHDKKSTLRINEKYFINQK